MKKKYKFLKNNTATLTKYWNYRLINKDKNSFIILNFLKRLLNFFLKYIGLTVIESNFFNKIDQYRYTSNYKILKIRNENICLFLISYFSNFGLNFKMNSLRKSIMNYEKIFRSDLIKNFNLNGGMGFNNGLILFCIVSYLNPKVLIESGVFRGFTSVLLDKATADDAEILCFDINLSRNQYKSKKIKYYNSDVEETTKINFKNVDFALFDDHVSHYDRLKFCLFNKINAIILDDDVGLTQVHSDGWPPIPTASMIYNYSKIPKKFNWYSHDQTGSANITSLRVNHIINYYNYIPLPSLSEFTGYKDSSFTSLILRKKS